MDEIQPSLPDTLQGWKGVSSRLIHQTGLSALNPFWQPDDFDRLIRSPEHFSTVEAYIREKPAKAALKTGFVLWERDGSRAEERGVNALIITDAESLDRPRGEGVGSRRGSA